MTRPLRWIAVALMGAVSILSSGTSAHAASAYRYWAYYLGSGDSWQYSQRGPATEYPADGQVQGWRFAVQSETAALPPRASPDFAALCGHTAPEVGHLRVGMVLDFGSAADAPAGEHPPSGPVLGCVVLPDGASGIAALDAAVGAAGVRIGTGADAGLVCGIAGYPRSECAAAATVTPTPTTTAPLVARPTPTATTPLAATPTRATTPAQLSASPLPPLPLRPTRTPTPTPEMTASAAPAPAEQTEPSSRPEASQPAASRTPGSQPASLAAAASSAAPLSLSSLRAAEAVASRGHFPVSTAIGGLVIAAIAAGAVTRVLRTRAGRRTP